MVCNNCGYINKNDNQVCDRCRTPLINNIKYDQVYNYKPTKEKINYIACTIKGVILLAFFWVLIYLLDEESNSKFLIIGLLSLGGYIVINFILSFILKRKNFFDYFKKDLISLLFFIIFNIVACIIYVLISKDAYAPLMFLITFLYYFMYIPAILIIDLFIDLLVCWIKK